MREKLTHKDGIKLTQAKELHLAGQFPDAEQLYKKLLRKYPRSAVVKSLLGSLLVDRGDVVEALPLLEYAATNQKDNADMQYNLGLAWAETGDQEKAVKAYRRAIKLNPSHTKAHYNLGLAYRRLGDTPAAVEALLRDYSLCPQADTCRLLYRSYKTLEQYDQALKYADECVALEGATPEDLDELIYLLCLKYTRQSSISADEREALFALADHAVALNPTGVVALFNQGRAYSLLGDHRTALTPLAAAVQLDPENDALNAMYGISLLTTGDLQAGWHYRTALSRMHKPVTETGVPRWQGEVKPGLRLWVTAEQGIGDKVLYARMLRDLIDAGVHVTLVCETRLHELLARSFPEIELHAALPEEAQRQQDAFATLGELHLYLRPDRTALPVPGTWLRPDPQQRDALRAEYQRLYPNKVITGLAWTSHSDANGAGKSVDLDELLPVLMQPDRVFVCVQYGAGIEELRDHASTHGYVVHTDAHINSLDDLDAGAAQLAALDELVSVSNASVHMAAAMGVPCRVLVGARPVWHWFDEGQTSPWYEDVRLYRQQDLAGWQTAVDQLVGDLQA